jgi:hypothetical protein
MRRPRGQVADPAGSSMMEFNMIDRNRYRGIAAAVGLVLSVATLCGCKSSKTDNKPTVEVSPERAAEIRAGYSAVQGYLVGDVEAVDAENHRAAVGGIDPKLINDQSVVSFVDSNSGDIVNSGTMVDQTPSGRIIVTYDPDRTAPKRGDLAVVKSASK